MAKKRDNKRSPQTDPVPSTPVWHVNSGMIAAVLIALAALTVYAKLAGYDFINLDDDIYVYENGIVAAGLTAKGIAWAFTSFHATNWHPVTWLSHQVDVSLFGLNAGSHHVVNLALHIANSLLLFAFLRNVTGSLWKSAIAAAVFAVHPTHVESVAWIAERKDVLSTLFWLLASICYVRFAKDTANTRAYWASLVLFALGLMSKPMLVTLPFVLLLLDYWPLKRLSEFQWTNIRPLIVEKLPFFALAAVSAIVTIIAQRTGGAVQSLEQYSVADRLLNALVSYAKYVVMLFYPADLGVWYPFEREFSAPEIAGSAILVTGISAFAIWQIRKRPYLFVGWFWFVGTLVPVIGFVQVGRQALADRYTYVPYMGLSIVVIWFIAEMAGRFSIPAIVLRGAGVIAVIVLGVVAFGQVSYWRNSETLYTRTLEVSPRNYLVEANLCRYLEQRNQLDEAKTHCLNAVDIDPKGATAQNTLGTILLKEGDLDGARKSLHAAIEIDPDYALPYANLAVVETKRQNVKEALAYFEQAVTRDKAGYFDARRRAEGFSAIGSDALVQKQYDVAIRSFELSLEAIPGNPDSQRNLAGAYRGQGRHTDAIKLLESIIQRNPNSAEAHNSLGIVYAELGRKQEAVQQFQRALQINPNFQQAQSNLRNALE